MFLRWGFVIIIHWFILSVFLILVVFITLCHNQESMLKITDLFSKLKVDQLMEWKSSILSGKHINYLDWTLSDISTTFATNNKRYKSRIQLQQLLQKSEAILLFHSIFIVFIIKIQLIHFLTTQQNMSCNQLSLEIFILFFFLCT